MKKWHTVLWLVLASIALTAGVSFVGRKPNPSDVEIASVNGKGITVKEYRQALNDINLQIDMYKTYAQAYGVPVDLFLNLAGLNKPEEAAFDRCIKSKLIDREKNIYNIQLDPDYFGEELDKNLPAQIRDQAGNINMEAYRYYLSKLHTDIAGYERDKEEELKRDFFEQLIKSSYYVPLNEAKEIFATDYFKKKFSILEFPFDKFLKDAKKIQPTKEELEKFFQRKKELYRIPEKRKSKYWMISPQEYAKKIVVDDEQIQNFYDRNKTALFRIPPKVKVRHILLKLDSESSPEQVTKILDHVKEIHKEIEKDPTKFAELAKVYSQDTNTASKGGLIDFFEKGTYDSDFERAALRLNKKNKISDVIKTKDGYEIIQLVERISATEKPLESVRDEIIKTVKARKALTSLRADLEKMFYKLKTDKDAISKFAQENNLKTEQTDWLSRKDAVGRDIKGLLAEKLFSSPKKQGIQGYFVQDDDYVIYQLSEIDVSLIPSFDSVEKKISDDYYKQKASGSIKLAARKAKREFLNDKVSLPDLGKKLDLKLIETDLIGKGDKIDALKSVEGLSEKAIMLDDTGQIL